MKFTRAFRTATVAAAMAFAATTASAQEPAAHQGHTDVAPPHADVTGRVAQLDERIALLTADTRMFAGEMKIQVMTELIEALIERQYLMERRMRPMHEMKNERMPHSKRPVRPDTMPESEEMSPETMCSPYI
jgi:C4-dicarboxylate-specific signal transduction histidine kinase